MIGVTTHKIATPLLVGLFFVLFVLKLNDFNISWWLVTAPLWLPPAVTLLWAGFQEVFYRFSENSDWD